MAITFDGANKRIILDSADVTADEIWSRWVDWHSANLQWPLAMRSLGGDSLGGSLYLATYFFLLDDWRIRPMEADHTLNITGNINVDGGGIPVVPTLGTYKVVVQYTVPVQAQAVGFNGYSLGSGTGIKNVSITAIASSAYVSLATHQTVEITATAQSATAELPTTVGMVANVDAQAQSATVSITATPYLEVVHDSVIDAVASNATCSMEAIRATAFEVSAVAQSAFATLEAYIANSATIAAIASNASTDFEVETRRVVNITAQAGNATIAAVVSKSVNAAIHAVAQAATAAIKGNTVSSIIASAQRATATLTASYSVFGNTYEVFSSLDEDSNYVISGNSLVNHFSVIEARALSASVNSSSTVTNSGQEPSINNSVMVNVAASNAIVNMYVSVDETVIGADVLPENLIIVLPVTRIIEIERLPTIIEAVA